jgi:hypothetical protein
MDGILRKTGAAEGGQTRVFKLNAGGAVKELFIFGIGARPTALNIIDAQLVKLLRNDEFIVG